jgi:hypothetical protein
VKPLPKKSIVEEKKDLHNVIEHHKRMIHKLQDQESRIRWRIEREAKQLSKLEQDQRTKEEMNWSR